MSDTRATERLFEVIEEEALVLAELSVPGSPAADAANARASRNTAAWNLGQAIGELRRRGDTLVRRDDLREIVEHAKENADEYHTDWAGRSMDDPRGPIRDDPIWAVLARLESAMNV